ncbi:CBS domain-containing protein [Traorella massiliensis]|uniref:CBS domain-containing protein n=2 Tax=Traorella TaxID=1929045 RepID=UPI0009F4E511|nr:CBS domain-containing protein [Traorella massiliensis]
MNVAFFLRPKFQVVYMYENDSIRAGLEKMKYYGYTSIPVINEKNEYVGTVSEGDFLWYLVDENDDQLHKTNMKSVEDTKIKDILRADKNPSIRITVGIEELLTRAMRQNFVPVVDDSNVFIGIVTRKAIIEYLVNKHD